MEFRLQPADGQPEGWTPTTLGIPRSDGNLQANFTARQVFAVPDSDNSYSLEPEDYTLRERKKFSRAATGPIYRLASTMEWT